MCAAEPSARRAAPALIALTLAFFLIPGAQPARAQDADGPRPAAPLARPGEPLPMDGVDDRHLGRPAPGITKRALAAPLPTPRERDRIVYAFPGPAKAVMTYDADLSAACRRGRFLQRTDMAYRAFGKGERPLGVAYGTMAINLIDPDRHREAEMVYFFDKQDTGRCAVYRARQSDIKEWFIGP